jgi:hypothetical protein
MINYNEIPVLIVPISDLPNTTIKRYFKVLMQASTFNNSFPEIKIGGEVLHKVTTNSLGTTIEIDAPGIKPYYKEFTAGNNDKVNEQGQLEPEGTIGQYNWLYWSTYYKVISPQEGIIAAVLEADQLNKFNQ